MSIRSVVQKCRSEVSFRSIRSLDQKCPSEVLLRSVGQMCCSEVSIIEVWKRERERESVKRVKRERQRDDQKCQSEVLFRSVDQKCRSQVSIRSVVQ